MKTWTLQNELHWVRVTVTALIFAIGLGYSAPAFAGGKRDKVIDFDDEVVEGMNKRPFDSLSQISEKDKKHRKPHLYKKRVSFRSESGETLRTMRFTP